MKSQTTPPSVPDLTTPCPAAKQHVTVPVHQRLIKICTCCLSIIQSCVYLFQTLFTMSGTTVNVHLFFVLIRKMVY